MQARVVMRNATNDLIYKINSNSVDDLISNLIKHKFQSQKSFYLIPFIGNNHRSSQSRR